MDTRLRWNVTILLLLTLSTACDTSPSDPTLSTACDTSPSDPFTPTPDAPLSEWSAYGGDGGGQRHSPLTEINPDNVNRLAIAWAYHTRDMSDGTGEIASKSSFQATPILVDETLYFCTPFNRVIALDPETGMERWIYDPHIDLSAHYANDLVCRGVSTWLDLGRDAESACCQRIFTATNDARLIALDAATGTPCSDFGNEGIVDLNPGVGDMLWQGEYQVTSPPTIVHDLVIVGSAVADNVRINPPSGVVRAWDARSGELRWSWDLAPPDFVPIADNTGSAGYALGTPNVWAPMSVDAERDLLFVPTGNPSPDYYRGDSKLDYYGSSVVALRASTGEVIWHYQTVHHDLWDFDVSAQPALVTLKREGQSFLPSFRPQKWVSCLSYTVRPVSPYSRLRRDLSRKARCQVSAFPLPSSFRSSLRRLYPWICVLSRLGDLPLGIVVRAKKNWKPCAGKACTPLRHLRGH